LAALWLVATSEGVGSGRPPTRRCDREDLDRWICGGGAITQRTLGDSSAQHGKRRAL
jgi:hypothetical protein